MDQPTIWIKREIEGLISNSSTLGPFSVLLLLGPRQVGKSSVLKRLLPQGYKELNFDDLELRTRANNDPILFGKEITPPCLLDEIQYAPILLSQVKILADHFGSPPRIWMTGSQSFEVMKGVRESLAGRVVILNLYGLSLLERNIDQIKSPADLFREMFFGSFPGLRTSSIEVWSRYMNSYAQTYIQRDVVELLGIQKRREFEIFLKLCALRTAQLVNYDDLARDSGVSPATVKDWLSILEDSFLIRLIHPHHSNRSKRLIKSPKLYFIDTGLCAYLAGWKDSEQIRLGPWAGAFFETAIFGEILRRFSNRGEPVEINFLRTKDKEEIDFIVESNQGVIPIEVKIGTPREKELAALEKFSEPNWLNGNVVSLAYLGREAASLTSDWRISGPSLDFV